MALGDFSSGMDGLGFVGLDKQENPTEPLNILGLQKCEGGDELEQHSGLYSSQHLPEQTAVRKAEQVNDFAMFGLSL